MRIEHRVPLIGQISDHLCWYAATFFQKLQPLSNQFLVMLANSKSRRGRNL
jgi:hypothetical protein